MPEKTTILVVDDSLVNLAVLDDILDRYGYSVLLANSGERAFNIAKDTPPDLILLDVVMPGWDGYETCRRFKEDRDLRGIPVLFLSGLGDTENKVRALQAGGVDYVSKPFQEEELLARVRTHAELASLRSGLEREVEKKTEEIRSLLDALQLAYQQAQESSMLKTQFLRNISHEFRTPMNIIMGTMDEMVEDTELDQEQQEMATTVTTAAKQLLEILTNMLQFSRQFEGEMQQELADFNLYQLIDEVISHHTPDASSKNIELLSELPPGINNNLRGNRAYIHEIFMKLVDNAVKYSDKGSVTVSAELIEDTATDVFLRFHVLDTGPGIPAEKRAHLFESFSQVDGSSTRTHGGMGMGLALAKLYTDHIGGEIGLTERPGYGCDFWLTLKLEKVPPTESPCRTPEV